MAGSITRIHSWLARSRGWAEPVSRALVLGLLYYTVASIALDAFVTRWRMGDSYVTSVFSETLAFENPRPQVYRVLTPLVIRAVSAAVPTAVADVLSPRSDLIRAWYGIESGNDLEYAVAYYLLFACLVGSMLAWRAAIATTFTGPRWIRDVAPVLAMLLYPMSFMRGGYLYDAPALFLSSACFAAFLKRRWWWFYGLFALAVLNKESEIVLPVWLFAAYLDDRNRRSLAGRGLLSVAIALPVIVVVRLLFAGHVGQAYELNLRQNLAFLANPSSYALVFDLHAAALPVPLGLNLLNLAILVSVLLSTLTRVPAIVTRSFVLTAATLAPLWLLFCYQDELRVFTAAFAPWTVMLAGWLQLGDRREVPGCLSAEPVRR
jgi:hypothetical protein